MEENKVSVKRKRVVLSLEEKLDVIQLRDNGISFTDISSHYNIGFTTIKDIMKRRKKIEEVIEKDKLLGITNTTKKTLCESKRPDVEAKLYDWLCEKLDNNEVITNTDILDRAQILSNQLYEEHWQPSKGWLSKFKIRYNLATVKPNITPIKTELIKDEEIHIKDLINEHVQNNMEDELQVQSSSSSNSISDERNDTESVSLLTPLYAADYLLNYLSANSTNFPLKEIITLQLIRDRVAEMEQNNEENISDS